MRLFDPGYVEEPFKSLCQDYPDATVYPIENFRVEWGPIFHRGRLDGSARVLLIGQDPAQNEAVVRRILVGEAGQRTQGFLAKLGIDRSYVMINTFLYSVYGNVPAKIKKSAAIADYRHRWLKALLTTQAIEAVVTLGSLANEAWQVWQATPDSQDFAIPQVPITHPTRPESASDGDPQKLREETKTMLNQWNTALQTLHAAINHPDREQPLNLYGDSWQPGDKVAIPDIDFPPGLPAWMRETDNWARRSGKNLLAKRRNITITVPKGVVPKL
ncbi:uracil-DNA glycosylase family protein [Nitrosomonas sp.]|uniref:uracil-DNA glycosylase family protein n=1 Tax=Nitrosomonas sp. TaxID=42353 RepID=UPI001DC9AC2F|nr:uracil-DNA glycosylase family protein [Nitrosomonas sp.]MBX3618073.1 uracil-DNA glycosylase [Nitrosomonas sp.]